MQEVTVCAVQTHPTWGEKEANMARAKELIADLEPGTVDFLVFPEMAFTGYVFNSEEEVAPFVEDRKGATYMFCRSVAQRLQCCVAAGYPEVDRTTRKPRYFNSMCVVDDRGELILNYRKCFLYETDKAWASKGMDGFQTFVFRGITVAVGICMDLNPDEFDFDKDTFALASFCRAREAKLLLFCTNWLMDKSGGLHNYWCWRLKPVVSREMHLVAANRVGDERGISFAGESCILSMAEPAIVAAADKKSAQVVLARLTVTAPKPAPVYMAP
mmetsp:Transcript_10587/g.32403  ORF Transcript_10587/g.32403 Transcript_10587/m.32403 type:complete len:272 (+) Transcript_10587:99-914(+)